MKTMKRALCVLALLALCLSLTACGAKDIATPFSPAGTDAAPAGIPDSAAGGAPKTEAPPEPETQTEPETPPEELGGSGSAPQLAGAAVGDLIRFGSYEQDNDQGNGPEPIDWQVLAREGDRIFVVSVYGLDCQPFDEENDAHGWKDCSLRRWLNEDFLNTAFSPEERAAIPAVEVPAGENSYFGLRDDFSGTTRDRVFCLSEAELHEYLYTGVNNLSDDRGYYCVATLYAEARGAYAYPREVPENIAHFAGQCGYWLRSPARDEKNAMICTMGLISSTGLYYNLHDTAVRPAMWIITD